jgi:ribokinase
MSAPPRPKLRIGVIGHLQLVAIGRVPALPGPGDIVHLEDTVWFPGGGGGVAFFQLVRSPADVVLFTAVGGDSAGDAVLARAQATGARVHAVRRASAHSRDVALVTPNGERTIVVIDDPLHPRRDDPLPWEELASCDAVFFTARDPAVIEAARAAHVLVVTARRGAELKRSGVRADVVVGSASDPREASGLADYPVPPAALVMTEGAAGGRIETAAGTRRFPASPAPARTGGAYGAGDSFAGALTWYVACGLPIGDACERASAHGAAVLAGVNPLENQLPLVRP